MVDAGFCADAACAVGKKFSGTVAIPSQSSLFQLTGHPRFFGLAGIVAIDTQLQQGPLTVFTTQSNADRYGRLKVHAYHGRTWLQGEMLEQGRALVYGIGQSNVCLAAMRRAERVARDKEVGVWEDGRFLFSANPPQDLLNKVGKFLVVEGKVLSVGDRSKRIYLNFGKNWSQDFTVLVVKKGKGAFKGDIKRMLGLKNKTVQVRGVLDEQQGPLLRLFDEVQIEVID